jgi:uncharacterized protein (TIGR02453 family)
MSTKNTLSFLKDLKSNNNRDWFLANQQAYQSAKSSFTTLIKDILLNLSEHSSIYGDIEASKCLFRINRDVRFSANKSPYKTNFGASINIFGKKSFKAGLYIHLEPGLSFIGGGCYRPPADILAEIRQEIDYNLDEFKTIINHKNFVKHFGGLDTEDRLKNPPRGYAHENEGIDLIKLKSFVAFCNFSDQEVTKSGFAQTASDKLVLLLPLLDFLNRSTEA